MSQNSHFVLKEQEIYTGKKKAFVMCREQKPKLNKTGSTYKTTKGFKGKVRESIMRGN